MHAADQWIRRLRLKPHPEGGYYRETYRAAEGIPAKALPRRFNGRRSFSTAICYLLRAGECSAFHRLRSDEVWHFYAGQPLRLHILSARGRYTTHVLGNRPRRGETPQAVVPAGAWFAAELARPRGFALVGCTVAPGFDFADFAIARRADLLALCPRRRALIARLTLQE